MLYSDLGGGGWGVGEARRMGQQTAKTLGKQTDVTAAYIGLDHEVYPAPTERGRVSGL